MSLKTSAVPSIFAWKQTSPRTWPPPIERPYQRQRNKGESVPEKRVFFSVLEPEILINETPQTARYWLSGDNEISLEHYESPPQLGVKRGRPRSLEDFFLTLCRLRQGFAENHFSHLFNSQATVSKIVISWINFMYHRFGVLNIWPSREAVNVTMLKDFKKAYPGTRVIINCTEVKCTMPSSLLLNSELFGAHKNHTTLKGLVGISPSVVITLISQLYTESISDREIVERSGILDLPFNKGDSKLKLKMLLSHWISLGLQIKCGLFVHFFATFKTLFYQANTIESFRLLLIWSYMFEMYNVLAKQGYVVLIDLLNLLSRSQELNISFPYITQPLK